MTIQIDIFYQLRDSDAVHRISIEPSQYFDPLEEGDTYEKNGIPKFNFTWEYLDVPRKSLLWSIERRLGLSEDVTFSTQYWDDGRSWLNHATDSSGYEELIHAFELGSEGYFTIRTSKRPEGRWTTHFAAWNYPSDDERYSLPEGAFGLATQLSLQLRGLPKLHDVYFCGGCRQAKRRGFGLLSLRVNSTSKDNRGAKAQMAILSIGRSSCSICGSPLEGGQLILATTHFIPDESDPLFVYSDTGMHVGCFLIWEHRVEFATRYEATLGRGLSAWVPAVRMEHENT